MKFIKQLGWYFVKMYLVSRKSSSSKDNVMKFDAEQAIKKKMLLWYNSCPGSPICQTINYDRKTSIDYMNFSANQYNTMTIKKKKTVEHLFCVI